MSLSARPQVMRLRRAVLQIPPKSSVPPGLLLHKNPHPLTRAESTLTQVLIPLHFISFISNTYKKPGGGTPSSSPKVWQLVNPSPQFVITPSPQFVIPSEARNLLFPPSVALSLPHYLITSLHRANVDAASSISPLFATLTENTGGGVCPSTPLSCSFHTPVLRTRTNPRNLFSLMELLHDSWILRGRRSLSSVRSCRSPGKDCQRSARSRRAGFRRRSAGWRGPIVGLCGRSAHF